QLARILHGSLHYSANRWFDKFLNVIIGSDGVCGLLAEHSASEGVTLVRMAESFFEHWEAVAGTTSKDSLSTTSSYDQEKPINVRRNCLSMDDDGTQKLSLKSGISLDANNNL